MTMIHRKCFVVSLNSFTKQFSLYFDLVIGCNDPYTSYDSIFGGHLLDVLTCKKCQKVDSYLF